MKTWLSRAGLAAALAFVPLRAAEAPPGAEVPPLPALPPAAPDEAAPAPSETAASPAAEAAAATPPTEASSPGPAAEAETESPAPPPVEPPPDFIKPDGEPSNEVLIIVGPPGEATFAPGFLAAAKAWVLACREAGASATILGFQPAGDGQPTDRERIQQWIQTLAPDSTVPVWIVFLGHGTWNGREARMNLRGPDVTPADLSGWLQRLRRPVVVVNGASGSGPFVAGLSAPGRIVVTATQGGNEINYARFGEKFAAAIGSPEADIDQDGQVSVLEAFVFAAQATQNFYTENARMASEHALLDDNGDRLGTPYDWYRGTRVVRSAAPPRGRGAGRGGPRGGGAPLPTVADGTQAKLLALAPNALDRALSPEQFALRVSLEKEIEALRGRKASLPEAEYFAQLEALLRRLAPLYVAALAPAEAAPLPVPPAPPPAPAGAEPGTPPAADGNGRPLLR